MILSRSSRSLRAVRTAGLVLVLAPLGPLSAQGRCGGDRAGTPACDTSAIKAPFAPTGWKTVALDHFGVQTADYKKEAAYFAALMNWKPRSDDGTKAVLDLGTLGGIEIRGGLTPQPAPPPPSAADSAAARARGLGAAGQRPRRNANWDSFAWVISPWNAKTVEAELKKRGLNPVADNDGKGFESFHVKDPDGFDVQLCNDAHLKARRTAVNAASPAPAPFESTAWKTIWLDHISFEVPNYKETTAWYAALLGWKPTGDEGSQNEVEIGDLGNVIIRGGNPLAPGFQIPAQRKANIGHVSFGITGFDADGTKNELTKRGLNAREDTGGKGDIHDAAAKYKSYHTTTPNGFDLQISNATKENRTVR